VRRRPTYRVVLAAVLVSAFGVTAACGVEEEERTQEERVREQTAQEGETAQKEKGRTEEKAKEGLRGRQRAGYYGEELAGNPTASGEPYDPYGFTAAHEALPFGTVLEVCYRGCTRVTINDRNPYAATDLDLSLAAADDIGLTPDGIGIVDYAEVVD